MFDARSPLPLRCAQLRALGVEDAESIARDVGAALGFRSLDLAACDRALARLRAIDCAAFAPIVAAGETVTEAIAKLEHARGEIEARLRVKASAPIARAARDAEIRERLAAALGCDPSDARELAADIWPRRADQLASPYHEELAVARFENVAARSASLRDLLVAQGIVSSSRWAVAREELGQLGPRLGARLLGDLGAQAANDVLRIRLALDGETEGVPAKTVAEIGALVQRLGMGARA